MRWLCVISIVFALSACANLNSTKIEPASAPVSAPDYDGPTVRRWSPLVSDLDETIRLYTEILGFELGSVRPDPLTSFVFEVYDIDPNIDTRHAQFHAGDDKRVLSVVEVPGMPPIRLSESPRRSALLINANGRFDEIKLALEQAGYETVAPHALGPTGIEMGFLDRDGHLYALYEIPYSGTYKFD